MIRVGLIDAGGANLGSVRYALERLEVDVRMVRTAVELEDVQRVILPGVGAAAAGMARLHAQGLVQPLRALQVPLMGICLGMQLLFERSEEGDVECLGLLPGIVRRLHPAVGVRVPHMGWNKLLALRESPLLEGVPAGAVPISCTAMPAGDRRHGGGLSITAACSPRSCSGAAVWRAVPPRTFRRPRRAHSAQFPRDRIRMSFTVYPALDIRNGNVVRLLQGDYAQQTTYGDDPLPRAQAFAATGAQWMHLVDPGCSQGRRLHAGATAGADRCADHAEGADRRRRTRP